MAMAGNATHEDSELPRGRGLWVETLDPDLIPQGPSDRINNFLKRGKIFSLSSCSD